VDADLVRDNRKRWKLALLLVALALAICELDHIFHFAGLTHTIAMALGIPLLISGLLVARWAALEKGSLDEPDPEEPPSILKL
jgi:hypothetical protein